MQECKLYNLSSLLPKSIKFLFTTHNPYIIFPDTSVMSWTVKALSCGLIPIFGLSGISSIWYHSSFTYKWESSSSLFHTHSHLLYSGERLIEVGMKVSCATFLFVKLSSCPSSLRDVQASVLNYAPRSSLHYKISCQAILWTDTLHPRMALGTHLTQFVRVIMVSLILYTWWSVRQSVPIQAYSMDFFD